MLVRDYCYRRFCGNAERTFRGSRDFTRCDVFVRLKTTERASAEYAVKRTAGIPIKIISKTHLWATIC